MRGAGAAVRTVQEYIRVIPVLAGQVREAASHIEHTVLDLTAGLGSLADRARRSVSSARAACAARIASGDVDGAMASSRHALQQLHARGVDHARRSIEATARIENAISALKVISLHTDHVMPVAAGIRSLLAGLEEDLTLAMTALRTADVDVSSLVHDTNTARRAIDLLGERDAAMRRELDAAARETEQLAGDVARAAAALQFQDRVDQRLQHVIDTLSEMQDEFVTALDRPDERTGPAGDAARRLRQRYTAAAAQR